MSEVGNPITYLNYLFKEKKLWNSLSAEEQKAFNPYIINLFISQHPDFITIVNELQCYTIGLLEKREVYKLYLGLLPKMNFFAKYIKSTNTEKYDSDLIDIIVKYYHCNKQEAIEYLHIYFTHNNLTIKLSELLCKYGKTEKEIKKLLKVKK